MATALVISVEVAVLKEDPHVVHFATAMALDLDPDLDPDLTSALDLVAHKVPRVGLDVGVHPEVVQTGRISTHGLHSMIEAEVYRRWDVPLVQCMAVVLGIASTTEVRLVLDPRQDEMGL